MYKCEFITKYILARTQSMDYPTQASVSPMVHKTIMAEALAIWDELTNKFNTDEIYKTDIRGNTRGIQS